MNKKMSLRSMLMSKHVHSLIGLAVSAALVTWIIISVKWEGVLNEIETMHYWAFIPSLIVIFGHYILRAIRWRYLLPATDRQPSILELHDAIMLGNFATYILPLRAGEFVRPFALTLRSSYSFATAFVSVVIERFFDLAFVLLSFGVVLQYVAGIPEWVEKGAAMLSILAAGIFLFIIVGTLFPELVRRISRIFTAPLPKKVCAFIDRCISDLLTGTAVLRHGGNLFVVLLLTAAVWGSCYGLFYVYAFLFDVEASLLLSVTLGVIIALAVAAPSAPGFIGVYQTACIASFKLFNLSNETAVAYSLVTHLFQYIVFILYTWWFFSRSELSFAAIFRTPVKTNSP